jgi:hypothetical protein
VNKGTTQFDREILSSHWSPYTVAAISEFAKHGHCRITDATLCGIREAERLLAIQYANPINRGRA